VSLDPRNFDPMRHEWWPSIAAMLSGEWTREAAMMDLRWHAVEVRVFRKAFPSRRQLMPRWGWTERRVRDLLASPEDWQDPMHPMSMETLRGEKVPTRSQQGPNEVPTMSQSEPTNADNTPERSHKGPNEVPQRSQQGPQARVSPSPTTVTDHRQDTQEAPAPAVAERAPRGPDLAGLWGDLVAFTPKPAAWKLTDKRRAHLQQRIAAHDVATVERVAEWVRTSSHERARFLRERGDPDTLLRPEKFDTYAAMSAGPAPRALTTAGARNTRGTLASDLFTDDDTPTPRPHAVDAAWSNA